MTRNISNFAKDALDLTDSLSFGTCFSTTYVFKPEFADLVRTGKKLQTIRALRKRYPVKGALLHLKQWSGVPRRSPQVSLGHGRCLGIRFVTIYVTPRKVHFGSDYLSRSSIEHFAKADGFKGSDEFFEFFARSVFPEVYLNGYVTFWDLITP